MTALRTCPNRFSRSSGRRQSRRSRYHRSSSPPVLIVEVAVRLPVCEMIA